MLGSAISAIVILRSKPTQVSINEYIDCITRFTTSGKKIINERLSELWRNRFLDLQFEVEHLRQRICLSEMDNEKVPEKHVEIIIENHMITSPYLITEHKDDNALAFGELNIGDEGPWRMFDITQALSFLQHMKLLHQASISAKTSGHIIVPPWSPFYYPKLSKEPSAFMTKEIIKIVEYMSFKLTGLFAAFGTEIGYFKSPKEYSSYIKSFSNVAENLLGKLIAKILYNFIRSPLLHKSHHEEILKAIVSSFQLLIRAIYTLTKIIVMDAMQDQNDHLQNNDSITDQQDPRDLIVHLLINTCNKIEPRLKKPVAFVVAKECHQIICKKTEEDNISYDYFHELSSNYTMVEKGINEFEDILIKDAAYFMLWALEEISICNTELSDDEKGLDRILTENTITNITSLLEESMFRDTNQFSSLHNGALPFYVSNLAPSLKYIQQLHNYRMNHVTNKTGGGVSNLTVQSSPEQQADLIKNFNIVKEGKASILFPKTNEVFYNPVQEFNRDLSIAVIRTWSEIIFEEREGKSRKKQNKLGSIATGTPVTKFEDSKNETLPDPSMPSRTFTILEALAATGLRAIRYAKELPNLEYVVANDLDLGAVNSIKRNIAHNCLSENLVRTNQGDASAFMYQHRGPLDQFDVIDLDPYGSAAPFLDGAVQAVRDGGLLCVTCTDAAVLTGANHPEKCYTQYGAMPVKGEFCHEMALRILLHSVTLSASRYRRYIVPLLTLSIDFYIRVFVRIFTSASEAKMAACKNSLLYVCTGCQTYYLHPMGKVSEKGNFSPMTNSINYNCDFCENKFHIGGPIWGYPLHDKTFLSRILSHIKDSNIEVYNTQARMLGMLTVASEEIDSPLFYNLAALSKKLHCTNPPLKMFCSALLNKGYKYSTSHAAAGSVKTDAPPEVVWDIMRSWVVLNPINWKNVPEHSPGRKILTVEASFKADFSFHEDAEPPSKKIKLVRYQINPQPNWGPMARASKKLKSKEEEKNDQEMS
ncbi:hypothetical protein G9A89_010338 [Geosiphon pyriformis]|nr:hypothetical protein G9A89_010338 [Geosiphon pyriformis]